MEDIQLKRINKYLSEVGYCSRRAADKLIEEGRVTINGAVPEKGTKIEPKDEVHVDGVLISKPTEEHVYIALNKPRGIVLRGGNRHQSRKRQHYRLHRALKTNFPHRTLR